MKHFSSILLMFFSVLMFNFACDGKNDELIGTENIAAFTVSDHNEVNFPKLKIHPSISSSSVEWVFPENISIKNKETVTYYFEKGGVYDVTLLYKRNGKKYSYTGKITILKNSDHYDRGEKLWWQDEFDDQELDMTNWGYDLGSNKESNLWGNNEWQDYTNKKENSYLEDGKLIIQALLSGEGQKVGDYTSARLITKGKKMINRGRVEVKARLGGGRGLWPAIWLYQSSWLDGYYSELDIMEYVGIDKDIIYSAVHTNVTKVKPENQVAGNKKVIGVENNFHIYGANWTDGKVEFYVDDPASPHLVFSVENVTDPNEWPFDKKLYLILNIAVGGDWGGMKGVDDSIFPQKMEVEYVRIFQK